MDPEKFNMADERTPLLTTVAVAPPRARRGYHRHTVRRCCTIACASTLIAAFVYFAVTLFTYPHADWRSTGYDALIHPHSKVSFAELEEIMLSTPEPEKAREWNQYYTAGAHLAGTNYSQVVWTMEKWKEFGVEQSSIVAYDTYINYPKGHRLALYNDSKLTFEATLEEDMLKEDPTTNREDRVPTFHGYSASGNVTGRFVYANYGTYQDFEDLLNLDISLEGKIAIVRYGGIFRGLKVKRAQDLGMIGVVIYTDPGDDGETTDENGVVTYPDGPARNPSSVQRGSVQFLSVAPGDPTTPGYPSLPGVPRQPVDGAIPSIPSIPISYVEALPILKSLNGIGPAAKDLNKFWTRNTGLGYKGVKYNVGPSPEGVELNLFNDQEYVTTPLWNVIGVINGSISDEVIVLGNHRDAWILGGAGDPNSGSAALNEVIRGFGKAVSMGWKPLRTVVFASWDGEEYGLIGSTEWVEEYLPWLSHANVAYVNVDVACSGETFGVQANPLLNNLIYNITGRVQSPNQTVPGQTVRDVWDGHIATMGSGSDFTAFQDFAGISSIDIGFHQDDAKPAAVYQYHSNYDSFYWMDTFGDPTWAYHTAMAKMFGLFAANLIDAPIVPFVASDYATGLKSYIGQILHKLDADRALTDDEEVEARARPVALDAPAISYAYLHDLVVEKLVSAHEVFAEAAEKLDTKVVELTAQLDADIPWWHWWMKVKLILEIRHVNTRFKLLDRNFLHEEGLDSRSWFKHIIFAPGLWTGYAGAVFPGLVEAIDDGDSERAEKWVAIIEAAILKAAKTL